MKKNKWSFSFIVFVLVLSFLFVPFFQNGAYVYADIYDDVFGNVQHATGDYVNNLVLLNFMNEENTLNDALPNNQFDVYNDVYNTNEHSLKSFYNQLSNGQLNLETEILEDGNNIEVINVEKNREHFMNYCFYNYDTASWEINDEGYFKYELVSSSTAPNPNMEIDFSFYIQAQHKYFVYGEEGNSEIPEDRDTSDGIISYSYAQELVNSNSNYYIVNGIERYLRELELISLISDQLDNKLDLTKSDNNNDNEIDIISLNVLDNPEKNYKIEWSELLWAHQSTLGAILDVYIDAGIVSGTLHDILNGMFGSVVKAFIKPHIVNQDYIDTYFNCAKNRPSVTSGSITKNINKYYLTTFNADELVGKSKFEDIKNVLQISTTAHELGHVLGLPDLYMYPSNNTDAVSTWSLMCYNTNPSQYMTAYEREQLGWLDEDNIITITNGGTYNLSATVGYDYDNVVAYKIQNEQDTNQWFYFEYRNKELAENEYWEQNTGEAGLLVYRVDTSILTGNMYAQPYGLYVFRDDKVSNATFGLNDEFGNFDTLVNKNVLSWQNGANNYTNSGFKFNVTNVDDKMLVFEFYTDENEILVSLNGDETKTIYVGEDYIDDGFTVLENGQQKTYVQDDNLSSNGTYKIEYEQSGVKVDNIDTSSENVYSIIYTIKDNNGDIHTLKRTLNILKVSVEISLSGATNQVIEMGSSYSELGIVVLENGIDVSKTYLQVDNSDKLAERTVLISCYKCDENYQVNDWTAVDIDTQKEGFYLVYYNIKDLYNESHVLIRKIQIVEGRKQVNGLDINIENKLKILTGEQILYVDSLINLDYIDLSNINISNIANLEQFEFKAGAILDLTSNNLSSFDEINTLLNTCDIKILLSGNKFDINYVGFITKLNNVVIGLQNDGEYQFLINQDEISCELYIYNDYSSYYDLYVNGEMISYDFVMKNYGTYEISLIPKENIDINKVVINKNICGLKQKTNDVSYRYNDSKLNNFNYDDYVEILGIEKSKLYFENTFDNIDKNSLSDQTFTIKISYNLQEIAVLEFSITIFDDVLPVISLNKNSIIYFLDEQDYINQPFVSYATSNDEFDGNLTLNIEKPEFVDYGKYEIVFSSSDSSGNSASEILVVYVGNVYLQDTVNYEYNTQISLPLNFEYFNFDNFIIKYKLQSQTTYSDYNKNDKIVFSNYGDDVLMVQAILLNDNSVVKNLTQNIKIIDTIIPTIELNGEQTVYVSVGGTYMDKGILVQDNTPEKLLTKQIKITLDGKVVDFVDTQTENEYIVEYKVIDRGGNTCIATRKVVVGYTPIVEMTLTDPSVDKIKVGKQFTISVYVFDNSNYDPNVKINWYINDVYYSSSIGLTQTFNIENAGDYNIYAQIDGTTTSSNVLQIHVEDEIKIDPTYIIIAISVASALVVVMFAWALIYKFKNRNFY